MSDRLLKGYVQICRHCRLPIVWDGRSQIWAHRATLRDVMSYQPHDAHPDPAVEAPQANVVRR